MKAFENITTLGLEKAVKVGNIIPLNGVGLAYFVNSEPNPKDSLKILDTSETIAENKILTQNETNFFYANELGILQDANGNTNFHTKDLTISDTQLSNNYTTERLFPDKINETDFLHFYYVSRFFIAAPAGYSITDMSDYNDMSFYKNVNIRVLDSQNQEYVDKNTGRKKYKILLDPYITEKNSTNVEIPYRVVVCLDASNPINLKLVYDKVECDKYGLVISQNLRYMETINAVNYYNETAEEASVISKNNNKVFSVKKFNKKYSEIFSHNLDYSSYQVFVPRKALFDNRNYEAFNWRLVARVNQPVNFDIVDNSANAEASGAIKQRVVNVGVLYDSLDTTSLENIKPYIFYRLQKSSFNLSNYIFQNPNVENATWIQSTDGGKPEKNNAYYWMVDINAVSNLNEFDVLTFCPTKQLSEHASNIIKEFVTIKNGTLIVDASNYPGGKPFVFSEIKLKSEDIATQVVEQYVDYVESSVLDEKTTGGWNIDPSIFNNETYGVYGIKKPKFRKIDTLDFSKVFLKVGLSSASYGAAGATFSFASTGDKLNQGNIIFTSFSFLEYCNSVYRMSELVNVANANVQPLSYEQDDYAQMPGFVEGPFKLLYNSILYGLYSRSQATRSVDVRSSLYNFVGPWESSWVMDESALMDDEKTKYFTNLPLPTSSSPELLPYPINYARDLTSQDDSIKKYYLKKVSETLPSSVAAHLYNSSVIDDNTDFYIEITNPDVIASTLSSIGLLSAVKITNVVLENFPSIYSLYKIPDKNQKLFAFTEKKSNKIQVPEGYGPYVLREMGEYKVGGSRSINTSISPSSYFKSYPFRFATKYSRISTEEKATAFNGVQKTRFNLTYKGTGEIRSVKVYGSVTRYYAGINHLVTHPDPSQPDIEIPGTNVADVPCTSILSGRESVLTDISGQNFKSFNYTWDIDVAQDGYPTATWRVGAKHPYVRYIKIMMHVAGLYKILLKAEDNNTYTAALSAAVKIFQTKCSTGNIIGGAAGLVPRIKLLYPPDGVIDSQTKSLMAYVLKFWQKNEPQYYQRVIDLAGQYGVPQFPAAVFKQIDVTEINSGGSYRRISFTGNVHTSPSVVEDFIFFNIPQPEKYETVKKIRITLDGAPWNKVIAVACGYSSTDPIQGGAKKIAAANVHTSYKVHKTLNKAPVNNIIEIDLSGVSTKDCRHFYIRLKTNGKQLGGKYGTLAEGFGIKAITADMVTAKLYQRPPDDISDNPFDYTLQYQAFPDIVAPELDELASFWLTDENGKPDANLSWSDGKLVSTLDKHLLYATLPDKFYGWNNTTSKWTEDVINLFVVNPDNNLTELTSVVKSIKEDPRTIAYKDQIVTTDVYINAVGDLTEDFSNVSSLSPLSIQYTPAYLSGKNILLRSVSYSYLGKKYSKTFDTPIIANDTSLNKLLNDLIVQNENEIDKVMNNGITVDFSKPSLVTLDKDTSVELSNVTSSIGSTAISPTTAITTTYHGDIPSPIQGGVVQCTGVKLSTSATYYSNSKTYISEEEIIDNYSLITVAGQNIEKVSSITSNDGVVLLCDSSGKPIGIPSPENVRDGIVTAAVFDPNKKFDINYGYVSISNKLLEENGFIYGFYDKKEKEFIGKLVTYGELITRGINNIYISAMAFDADGNVDTSINYVGAQSTNSFKPVTINPKMIAPVYSVKYNNSSAIKIVDMNESVGKNEAWPLKVSVGSFNKEITLSNKHIFTDWKSKYINQTLYCTYDTSVGSFSENFSRIYGRGCKDITNEIPIVISSKKIKLRHFPILSVAVPVEKDTDTLIPAIVPVVDVYIRADQTSSWTKIPRTEILDIDAENGYIEFDNQIISSNENLIKVNYTIKDTAAWIYQVEGQEVPLNAFLNSKTIDENKPIYIYLLPTEIDINDTPMHISDNTKNDALISDRKPLVDYVNSYPVHFTYDFNIFDQYSYSYNPIALMLGVVYISNSDKKSSVNIYDIRVRGGGITADAQSKVTMDSIDGSDTYWDMHSINPKVYPRGGYTVIRMPDSVKDNFNDIQEIYDIVNRNITAGVSFEIQNPDAMTWSTKTYE